tara:strand:+ start:719 stop:970 length:252 start_codon:yes stop_codon:yes gene_type:complete
MTKKQIYFDQLVQYLSEPKDNDPFDKVRIVLLGMTKDKAVMRRVIDKLSASPVSNLLVCDLCEEPLEKVMGKVCENTMCDRYR